VVHFPFLWTGFGFDVVMRCAEMCDDWRMIGYVEDRLWLCFLSDQRMPSYSSLSFVLCSSQRKKKNTRESSRSSIEKSNVTNDGLKMPRV